MMGYIEHWGMVYGVHLLALANVTRMVHLVGPNRDNYTSDIPEYNPYADKDCIHG